MDFLRKSTDKWTLKDCVLFFVHLYKKQNGVEYNYSKAKMGFYMTQIKRLKMKPKAFVLFLLWLQKRHRIASINLLHEQINDYYASKEYQEEAELQKNLLHYKIMDIKRKIVNSCTLCGGSGFLQINENGGYQKCDCMKKYLNVRKELKEAYDD